MSVNSKLPTVLFGQIPIPYTSRSAKLTFRHHVHEFPKQPAGAIEKLGRKVYEFSFMGCPYHETDRFLPNLYTKQLPLLQTAAANGVTDDLQMPDVGAIYCFISSFERTRQGRILSGEEVNITFTEDATVGFNNTTTTPGSSASLVTAYASLTNTFDSSQGINPLGFDIYDTAGLKTPWGALFDAINDVLGAIDTVSNTISAVGDQAQLYSNLLQSKLAKVGDLCKAVDSTETVLLKPQNSPVAQAVHDVWDAATSMQKDLLGQGTPTVQYVVPATQAVATIAQSLYGDASRGGQILQLNRVPDPFAIKAGTTLVVYAK